ncbi:MAG: ComEC/Rec2 family competence protein [Flavobacteriaceae bacterium]
MPHPSTPIAVIALSLSAGILLRETGFEPSFFLFVASTAVLIFCHFKRMKKLFLFTACSCFLLLGTIRYKPPNVTVSSKPDHYTIEIKTVQNTTAFGYQYVVKTTQNENALLQTNLENKFTVGERLLVHGTFVPIAPPKNPTDFDFRTYMRHKGVSRKLVPTNEVFILVGHKSSVNSWAFAVQQKLISKLKKTPLREDSKALVMALVLGNKKELTEERIQQYQRAGAMHLLAISGLHIGVVLLLLRFLVAPLKRIRYGTVLAAVLPIVFLWCFALITGGASSVIRAVTMFSFLQIGLALKRKNVRMQGVWVSFVVLLFVQPQLLFDVGFQLSYAAVFGIVWMMPHWQRLFVKKNRLVRYVAALIGIGGIAQLSVLPLSLFYFHQFPMLFWLSNLVLVPFVGIIIMFGIGCIVMSFFSSADWFFTLADTVFWGYQWVVAWIAQWEGFFVEYIPFRAIDALLLGMTILVLFYLLQSPKKNRIVLFGMLSLVFHAQLYLDWEKPPKATITQLYKNSLLLIADNVNVIAIAAKQTPKVKRMAQQFQQHYRLKNTVYKPMQHAYTNLLVVDSLGTYRGMGTYQSVLLRQSPKIHLGELIDSIAPQIIIADGSNYPSFISRWEKTCAAKGIRFHATATQGAYPLN